MKTSKSINEIAGASSKVWGEIANPIRDKQNPGFKHGNKVATYADIASGLNAARPVLSKHGLTVFQTQRMVGDMLMLDTRLSHSSGQWIEGEYPVCKFPAKPQDIMAALTYARRGALFSLIGIAGDDDDGNEANKLTIPSQKKDAVSNEFDVDTSQVTREIMREAIGMAHTFEELAEWFKANKANIAKLHEADRVVVLDEMNDREDALKGKVAAE